MDNQMKKYIISAILLFSIALFSHAQTGTWSGKLDVPGTKISLVFHLDEENPTMDSPDQGANSNFDAGCCTTGLNLDKSNGNQMSLG